MKKEIFIFLNINIPVVLKYQINIQCYSKKVVFGNKFVTNNKMEKVPNILEWFVKIVEDYENQQIIIKYIENMIEISEMMMNKLKIIMKKKMFKVCNWSK